ncbi:protein phosphatase 2C domain-containing protein [Bacillus sp. FJAT-27251]|uniref:PP2C family protein-serine/threonine phosphatase n=1 Tax=Bacillus sp. FJAT-27251 TaxID=1684142 RepID=UPI0006A769BF|nr:protein phosphatase 2C domain-containing protein [Bacillus sp. FJAT-27251]
MAFQMAYHTDIGIKKKSNQDGLLMKTARTPEGEVGLFAICDGMGGLSHGELASATVIRGLSDWFDQELPTLLRQKQERSIISGLQTCITALNDKIFSYGKVRNIQLGTTLSALLVLYSRSYIIHVGDSRIYSISSGVTQLTKDQSLVAREVERGNLTAEQARRDPRRNILLQCIGATENLDITITEGLVEHKACYLLCTDGFYHEVLNSELAESLQPGQFNKESQLKVKLVELVELVKSRQETDNISVIAVSSSQKRGETA